MSKKLKKVAFLAVACVMVCSIVKTTMVIDPYGLEDPPALGTTVLTKLICEDPPALGNHA